MSNAPTHNRQKICRFFDQSRLWVCYTYFPWWYIVMSCLNGFGTRYNKLEWRILSEWVHVPHRAWLPEQLIHICSQPAGPKEWRNKRKLAHCNHVGLHPSVFHVDLVHRHRRPSWHPCSSFIHKWANKRTPGLLSSPMEVCTTHPPTTQATWPSWEGTSCLLSLGCSLGTWNQPTAS